MESQEMWMGTRPRQGERIVSGHPAERFSPSSSFKNKAEAGQGERQGPFPRGETLEALTSPD